MESHPVWPLCLVPSLSIVCSGTDRGAAGVGASLLLAVEGCARALWTCVSICLPLDSEFFHVLAVTNNVAVGLHHKFRVDVCFHFSRACIWE